MRILMVDLAGREVREGMAHQLPSVRAVDLQVLRPVSDMVGGALVGRQLLLLVDSTHRACLLLRFVYEILFESGRVHLLVLGAPMRGDQISSRGPCC